MPPKKEARRPAGVSPGELAKAGRWGISAMLRSRWSWCSSFLFFIMNENYMSEREPEGGEDAGY